MKNYIKTILLAFGLVIPLGICAQKFQASDIILKTETSSHSGRIRVLSIENLYESPVEVFLINEYDNKKTTKKLQKGERVSGDFTLNVVKAKAVNEAEEIVIYRVASTPVPTPSAQMEQKTEKENSTPAQEVVAPANTASVQEEQKIIGLFNKYVETIPFLSDDHRVADSTLIAKHIEYLGLSSTDKSAYIKEQNLQEYVRVYRDSIKYYRDSINTFVTVFLNDKKTTGKELSATCQNELTSIVEDKIIQLEDQVSLLQQMINEDSEEPQQTDWKLFGVIGGFLLLCIALVLWYHKTHKAQQTKTKKNVVVEKESDDTTSGIEFKSITPKPVLRKQSLEDIYDNAAYLCIKTEEFCADSSVRALYIKNTCIKDIYNMYADDLRNPANPKEDGCMVLGRWVQDEETKRYDVSLEYIVLPGDDAIFSEYELYFGGKIKLKVSDKLRKLRKETGLQYDLTCWVHSHPGLGVFFSNSDNNVHMQLKNPEHPLFLTALVIDVLTPEQETGIFTFKQNEEINSKQDLTKMYSLEEMYKWALSSERRSFKSNDHYNTLNAATQHIDSCHDIQLSNSAIIDMTFLAANPNGFIGFIHGYTVEQGSKLQCIVASVSKGETAANNEMLGCFVVASHCSIPSIRKTVSKYLKDIRFVLVYTATDGLLTSIPVNNQDLCASEEYYGEQKLEELKIWTRRRR